jgi:hypothetical protein
MEFRLIYRGPQLRVPLHRKAEGKARNQKTASLATETVLDGASTPADVAGRWQRVWHAVWRTAECGDEAVTEILPRGAPLRPLGPEDIFCALNILFLRRDAPGKVVSGDGDLDNRLKTLFDALRVPNTADGLPSPPEDGFNPVFCLLEMYPSTVVLYMDK